MRRAGIESTPAVLDGHDREDNRYYGDHDQPDVAEPVCQLAPIIRAHPIGPPTPARCWGPGQRTYA